LVERDILKVKERRNLCSIDENIGESAVTPRNNIVTQNLWLLIGKESPQAIGSSSKPIFRCLI